jgi:DNA-binding beta-propeller fold protein YncE
MASAGTAFAFLFGLGHPAQADLLVSLFGTSQVAKFTDNGQLINATFLNGGATGSEGISCINAATSELFVANNGTIISVVDLTTGTPIPGKGPFILPAGTQVAGLTLSSNGQVLYAADFNGGRIFVLNASTGAILNTVNMTDAHDVAVGPDGSVYATAIQGNLGVIKFPAPITGNNILTGARSTFIPSGGGKGSPFGSFAGMVFDGSNLWVTNFSSTSGAIYEYDASGVLEAIITTATNTDPLGLALGPPGPNQDIYVAEFNANRIERFDPNNPNAGLSLFISSVGSEPKYLEFTENCCHVPEPASFVLLCSGLIGLSLFCRRRKA